MKIIIHIIIALLLTGCGVSRFKQQNWIPQNSLVSDYFYRCLKDSQQIESSAGFGANQNYASGYANTGYSTNDMLFVSCMNSKGYYLRKLTRSEAITSLLTFPIAISIDMINLFTGERSLKDYY